MFVDILKKQTASIPVELHKLDGTVVAGSIHVVGNDRVLDLMNDDTLFFPFHSKDGEFSIINKRTIAEIKPFDKKRMADRYRMAHTYGTPAPEAAVQPKGS